MMHKNVPWISLLAYIFTLVPIKLGQINGDYGHKIRLWWFHPIQMRSNVNRIFFDFSIVDPISNQLKNRSFVSYEKWKEIIAHQNIYTCS